MRFTHAGAVTVIIKPEYRKEMLWISCPSCENTLSVYCRLSLNVPSQATIQAIKSPKTRSGQYTSWKQSESSISYAGSNGRSDSNGFPAYVGAAGNKAADRAAKEASENSLEELEPDTLRVLK